jgi:hypothetical protein
MRILHQGQCMQRRHVQGFVSKWDYFRFIVTLRFSAESVSNKRGGMIRLLRRRAAREMRGPRARMRVKLRVNFF